MDIPFVYEIRVEGHLPDHWSQWFEGLSLCRHPDNETTLIGVLIDQAALFGVLARIHDRNLILISVARSSAAETMEPSEQLSGKN